MSGSPISEKQKADYQRDGYILVSGLIPGEVARRADEFIWRDLGLSPQAPEAWPQNSLSGGYNSPEILACYTPEFLAAAADLCGAEPASMAPPGGALAINIFPQQDPWQWPGPHIDHAIKDHGHKTFPLPFRVATMTFLHQVAPRGGGTVVWPRSHRAIEDLARSRPDHYGYMWVLNQELDRAQLEPPVELTPAAGDVLFYQCLCAHAGSSNTGDRPRFALNHKW